jgi:hypothetical protein
MTEVPAVLSNKKLTNWKDKKDTSFNIKKRFLCAFVSLWLKRVSRDKSGVRNYD